MSERVRKRLDLFASAALAGMLADGCSDDWGKLIKRAFDAAEAMLDEENKRWMGSVCLKKIV